MVFNIMVPTVPVKYIEYIWLYTMYAFVQNKYTKNVDQINVMIVHILGHMYIDLN